MALSFCLLTLIMLINRSLAYRQCAYLWTNDLNGQAAQKAAALLGHTDHGCPRFPPPREKLHPAKFMPEAGLARGAPATLVSGTPITNRHSEAAITTKPHQW